MPSTQNKNQVNRELQRLGFGTLKDPTLPDQFAAVIRDHSHFRGILMHIPQGLERKNWYDALSAKVRFKAKPLADYEMESRMLAEANQLPTYDPKTLEVKEYTAPKIESEEYKQQKGVIANRRQEPDKLAKVAEEAIDRDLREGQATQELSLVCRACTFEQKFRVKKRGTAYKIARQYGWSIEAKGTTALCRSCKPPAIQ